MKLIFIYGAPAVGKLTVAREIAELTGFKLFHNHLSIDAVTPVFEFGTKTLWKLVHSIRLEVIAEAARENVNLIYTFCYAKDSDDAFVARITEAVELNGGEVCFVLLTCERSELEKCVVAESRKEFGKANNLKILCEILDRYDLYSPVPQRKSLHIENTNLSPADAAKRIIEHYRLV